MLKKIFLSSVCFLAFAFVCFAQDFISGHWAGKIMGAYDIAYDFKANDTLLTGTVTGTPGSKPQPISNGVIKGDLVFFKMPSQTGEDLDVKGRVKGDTLTIAFNAMGMDISAALNRVKIDLDTGKFSNLKFHFAGLSPM